MIAISTTTNSWSNVFNLSLIPAPLIRTANAADWEQISQISRHSGYEDYINAMGKSYLDSGDVLVYEEGKIRGFSKVEYLEDGSAWLSGLRVDPVFWRMGVATKLTEESLLISVSHGCKIVRMLINDENEQSMGLSLKLGFHVAESFYYINGTPVMEMLAEGKSFYDGLLDVGWKYIRKNTEIAVRMSEDNRSGWVIFRGDIGTAQILRRSDEPLHFEWNGHTCVSAKVGLNHILESLLDLDFSFAHVMEKNIG